MEIKEQIDRELGIAIGLLSVIIRSADNKIDHATMSAVRDFLSATRTTQILSDREMAEKMDATLK